MKALLRITVNLLAAVACAAAGPAMATDDATGFIVIANRGVGSVDAATLQRLYTGRAIEVAGVPVTVVNAPPGSALRERFLGEVIKLDNQHFIAYWTVRRHVGKGVPPRELSTAAEVIEFVQATPGGLGYLSPADLRPGLNVVFTP